MNLFKSVLEKIADKIGISFQSKKNKARVENSSGVNVIQINGEIVNLNRTPSEIIVARETKLQEFTKMLWSTRRELFRTHELHIPPNSRIDIINQLPKIREFFEDNFFFCSQDSKKVFRKFYHELKRIAGQIWESFGTVDELINQVTESIERDIQRNKS